MERADTGGGLKFSHLSLFFLTFAATVLTGISLHPDGSDISEGLLLIRRSPLFLLQGLPYSLSLLFIIACHEYGHLAAGRKNGMSVTMPYFIPGPPYLSLGTFGAFIKIKSHIPDRSALIEMGALGPVYGFAASLIVLTAGFMTHSMGYHVPADFGFNIRYPIGFAIVRSFFTGNFEMDGMLFENPLIASAWIGFFIQGLNLLPVGQLDGGHILYGLFRKKHRSISRFIAFAFIFLTPFGFHFLIWSLFFFILGFNHPPTIHDDDLPRMKGRILAAVSLLIFLLSFHPLPFVT